MEVICVDKPSVSPDQLSSETKKLESCDSGDPNRSCFELKNRMR